MVSTTVRPARLVQVVQLTQTGQVELGNGAATDGTRVYFTQRDAGRWSLAQVSVEGGTPLPLPLPLEQPLSNPDILDISPDRSNLLVSSGPGTEVERPFWVVPTAGGSPRRVGDVAGHAGAWSRDGSHIVFARGSALFLVASDGTDSRKLLDTPGIPYSIRWAPPVQRGRAALFHAQSQPGAAHLVGSLDSTARACTPFCATGTPAPPSRTATTTEIGLPMENIICSARSAGECLQRLCHARLSPLPAGL